MVNECWFQGFFVVAFAALVIIWGRSIMLSGTTRDSFWSPLEGFLPGLILRLLQAASVAGMSVYSAKPQLMNWSRIALPWALRLLGVPLAVFAILLLFLALSSLGTNFSLTVHLKEKHNFVTKGPYRWVRHPMYCGFFFLWFAYFLLSANWFIGATGILAQEIIMVIRTPKEEQMMAGRFGEEYVAYTHRTGRFFPRLRILDQKARSKL